MIRSTPGRISLPTVNWLAFPDGSDPEPMWFLPDVLEGVAAAGAPGVGLDDYNVRRFLRDGYALGDVAAHVDRLGLRCTDVGILRIGVPGSLELATLLAELAGALATRICVAAIYAPLSAHVANELCECAGLVSGSGARLALEFAPYSPLRTLEEARALCDRVGWDRCGLLLDVWHVFRSATPLAEVQRLDADHVALVHLSDAPEPVSTDLQHESRFRRVPPGAGVLPIDDFVDTLQDIGYRGPVSAEVLSSELRAQPPVVGARILVEALRRVWPETELGSTAADTGRARP